MAVAPIAFVAPPRARPRDSGIDLVRALCVVVVVVLHALMVGVSIGPAGPVFENAAEGTAWVVPLTWVAQIMPVFFVIGGFAGATAYRRARERGGSGLDFVAARVPRLLLPAVLSLGAVGVGLAALAAAGVAGDIVQIAGFRYSQPLWFLGVFLLCQALLPLLHRAHERAPGRSILTLVAVAVTVDLVRGLSGLDMLGCLNLAFVWLALQQLGFFIADGHVDALPSRTRAAVAGAAVGLLALAVVAGVFSPDMLENLNPPTTALLLLGLAQTMVLSLLRRRLRALSARPRVAAFTRFVTARTMTIYLWHMPVLLAMAGVSALGAIGFGMPLPAPSSMLWWLTRPLWIAAVLGLVAAVAVALAGCERRRIPASTPSTTRGAMAVLLGLGAVVLQLVAGTTVLTAVLAVALLGGALRLARTARSRQLDAGPLTAAVGLDVA